jgi:transcriptional regulator with XRE-family HTH domain
MANLGELLKMKGKKQRALAQFLNVGEPAVSRWVAQDRGIPTRHIIPIANFLGVPAIDVLAIAVPTEVVA